MYELNSENGSRADLYKTQPTEDWGSDIGCMQQKGKWQPRVNPGAGWT